MAGFHVGEYGCNGTLTVGVGLFPLNCPAWDIVNLAPLWTMDTVRGENLALPRIVGRRGYPRHQDEGIASLVLWVRGDVDKVGVANSDHWQGLSDNLDELWTNVTSPVTTDTGTRAATLTLPNGITTRTADCQFEPLVPSGDNDDPNAMIYTLRVVVPAGRFV